MNQKPVNLMLIGFGPHAQRIYYPVCRKEYKKYNFAIVCGFDLAAKKENIENYLKEQNESSIEMHYISDRDKSCDKLTSNLKNKLDEVVEKFAIKGVIISTEPRAHMIYARWALKKGLSVLMDKPISAHDGLATSLTTNFKLIKDYKELVSLYKKAKKKNSHILFSLMAQRRFHPAFSKVKSLISEVFQKTDCPVTSIQSFHSDGQWRLPSEIVDLDYHSYNFGFGKCCHTGYHSLDIVPWLLEGAESEEKRINNVDIFANFSRPSDFFEQLDLKSYEKIFPDFAKKNKYDKSELKKICKNYGEIDAFNSLAFKHGNSTITLGSINLMHNSFSQRGWLSIGDRNLYKGNGRVRHEGHYIEQGPFQAISYISYQSKEVRPENNDSIYDIGGEYNLDIHVFRNNKICTDWKNYEKFSIKNLGINIVEGKSRGHQEDARREAILEFIHFLTGRKADLVSDLTSHFRGTMLLYGIYKSAAFRFHHKNPLVNIDF